MKQTLLPTALLIVIALASSSSPAEATYVATPTSFDECVFGFGDPRPQDGPNQLAIHYPLNSAHQFEFNRYMDWFKVDAKTHASITQPGSVILGRSAGASTWTLASPVSCPEIPQAVLVRVESQSGSLDGKPTFVELSKSAVHAVLSKTPTAPLSISVRSEKPLIVEVEAALGDWVETYEVAIEREKTGWIVTSTTLVVTGPANGSVPTGGTKRGWIVSMHKALRVLFGR